MKESQSSYRLEKKIKFLIIFFMTALVISGLTAFPIKSQLEMAVWVIQNHHWKNEYIDWIERVHLGVTETSLKFSFIAYGTDWLGFAHLVIALAFIGPLRDPIRNIWVIQFGLISCIAVFPLALIAGEIRGIPMFFGECSIVLSGYSEASFCGLFIKRSGNLKRKFSQPYSHFKASV